MTICAANVSLSKFKTIKQLILIVCMFIFLGSHAQVTMSPYTKMRYAELVQAVQKKESISALKSNFSIEQIEGGIYVNFLAKINTHFTAGALRNQGILVGSVFDSIATFKFPIDQLLTLEHIQGVELIEFSEYIQQQANPATVASEWNNNGVHSGEGVVLGVFGNSCIQAFANNWSKLIGFWDQTAAVGPSPNGFEYGVESSSLPEYQTYLSHSSISEKPVGFYDLVSQNGMLPKTDVLAAVNLPHESALLDALFWMHTSASKSERRLIVPLTFVYREDLYPIEHTLFSVFISQLTAAGTVVMFQETHLEAPVYVHSPTNKSAVSLSLNRKSSAGSRNYMVSTCDSTMRIHFSYSYPVPLSDSLIHRHVVLQQKQSLDTLMDFGSSCFRLRMFNQPALSDQQQLSSLIEFRTDFELNLTCWFDNKDTSGYLFLNPCMYHKGELPVYDTIWTNDISNTKQSLLPVACDNTLNIAHDSWKRLNEKLAVYAWMIEEYPVISVGQMHNFWGRVHKLPQTAHANLSGSVSELDSIFYWCKSLKMNDSTFLEKHTVWHVYPQQVQRTLYVNLIDELPSHAEFIDDKGGVFVKKIFGNGIDVSNLRPGPYTIRLLVNGVLEEQKFIKL